MLRLEDIIASSPHPGFARSLLMSCMYAHTRASKLHVGSEWSISNDVNALLSRHLRSLASVALYSSSAQQPQVRQHTGLLPHRPCYTRYTLTLLFSLSSPPVWLFQRLSQLAAISQTMTFLSLLFEHSSPRLRVLTCQALSLACFSQL